MESSAFKGTMQGSAIPVDLEIRVSRDLDGVAPACHLPRQCLDMGEQTCFLHALCRTPLTTNVSVTRNG